MKTVALTKVLSHTITLPALSMDSPRRRRDHIIQCAYTNDTTATTAKSGCRRCIQRKIPPLARPASPSPNRTCGTTHQEGISSTAIRETTDARSTFMGL